VNLVLRHLLVLVNFKDFMMFLFANI